VGGPAPLKNTAPVRRRGAAVIKRHHPLFFGGAPPPMGQKNIPEVI